MCQRDASLYFVRHPRPPKPRLELDDISGEYTATPTPVVTPTCTSGYNPQSTTVLASSGPDTGETVTLAGSPGDSDEHEHERSKDGASCHETEHHHHPRPPSRASTTSAFVGKYQYPSAVPTPLHYRADQPGNNDGFAGQGHYASSEPANAEEEEEEEEAHATRIAPEEGDLATHFRATNQTIINSSARVEQIMRDETNSAVTTLRQTHSDGINRLDAQLSDLHGLVEEVESGMASLSASARNLATDMSSVKQGIAASSTAMRQMQSEVAGELMRMQSRIDDVGRVVHALVGRTDRVLLLLSQARRGELGGG
jgi:hypothetical protein